MDILIPFEIQRPRQDRNIPVVTAREEGEFMGLGGISVWQLLIVLVIVMLLFGTRKLSGLGSDLGGAVKEFKKAISHDSRSACDDA